MNRIKIWVLTLLAVGAGVAGVYLFTSDAVERAQSEQDARLAAATALFGARAQLLARQVLETAEAAARAEPVRAAVAAGAGLPAAAQGALESAAKANGLDPSHLLLGAAQGQAVQVQVADKALEAKEPPVQRAVEASGGKAQKGFAHTADGVFSEAAVPAGPGAALIAGAPLDVAFARAFRAESGVEVLVSADVKKTVTTLSPIESPPLFALPRTAGAAPVSVGHFAGAEVAGVKLPLLFAAPPAWRVHVEKLGASGAALLLALPVAPRLAGLVAFQYAALAVLAVLLLLGLAFGATARDGARVPKELLAAAEKIGRGDYTARAPVVAGQLGAVGQAMNRAAQAALAMQAISREEPATQAPPEGALPTPGPMPIRRITEPAPVRPAPQAPPAPPAAQVPPPEPVPAPAPFAPASPASDLFGAPGSQAPGEASYEPPPAHEPPPAPTVEAFAPPPSAEAFEPPPADFPPPPPAFEPPPPAPEPPAWQVPQAYEPPPPALSAAPGQRTEEEPAVALPPPRSDTITGATNLTTPTRELMLHGMAAAAELRQAAEPAPAPAPSAEEQVWREVYQRFLEARAQSGEGTAGLSWEKFEAKLQKNREQLQAKYGCREVRFSVYLKDGRAALKATPVK